MNITQGSGEAGPTIRRFTLRDGMVLIVASAVGFAMVGSLGLYRLKEAPWNYADLFFLFELIAIAPAVLFLRLIPPRPTLRDLCRRPGFAALAIGAVILAAGCLVIATIALARLFQAPIVSPPWPVTTTAPAWWSDVLIDFADQVGLAVIAGWILLAPTGLRRPGRDWPEIAGVAIGIGWILFFAAITFTKYYRLAT